MRSSAEYRNHGSRARSIARLLDALIAPIAGSPREDVRRSTSVAAERILLIRPDHAGDLLMATPAIRALRQAHPKATIDVLVSPWGAPAIEGNPDIDSVRTIEATWFEPGRREGPDPSRLIGSVLGLRRGRYAAAADLRGDVRSILLARASGAPCRAGFSRVGLEQMLTERVPFDPSLDHISRNHKVVELLGAAPLGERRPIFVVPERARARVERLLDRLPSGTRRLAVFPGTNRPSASWGGERFTRVCSILAERRPLTILLGGREQERPATEEMGHALAGAGCEVVDLAGLTSFAEAAALIEQASALIANDSGASHLAVAVGTPVISIFGRTDPGTLWTWDHPERYVAISGPSTCPRPCFRAGCPEDHGYSAIDPEAVADRLEMLMDTR